VGCWGTAAAGGGFVGEAERVGSGEAAEAGEEGAGLAQELESQTVIRRINAALA